LGKTINGFFIITGRLWVTNTKKKKVILELIGGEPFPGRQREIDYETLVMVTPSAYKDIRPELLPDWHVYKEWPYDEEGNFCWPPRDYTNWKQEK
jgi:hypothetical protein